MKKNKNQKAFTLVEMMIVIFIIACLSAIFLINYRSSQRQLALDRAANKLAQDLRTAQEMAMAAEGVNGCIDMDSYKYGAGIALSKLDPDAEKPKKSNKYMYVLFADCNGNNKYEPPPAVDEDIYLELIDFTLVEVSSLIIKNDLGNDTNLDSLDIIFVPPDPLIIFNQDQKNLTAQITIRLRSDTSKTKTIKVNKAGLIEVQ